MCCPSINVVNLILLITNYDVVICFQFNLHWKVFGNVWKQPPNFFPSGLGNNPQREINNAVTWLYYILCILPTFPWVPEKVPSWGHTWRKPWQGCTNQAHSHHDEAAPELLHSAQTVQPSPTMASQEYWRNAYNVKLVQFYNYKIKNDKISISQ